MMPAAELLTAKIAPHSLEAERAVLGIGLMDIVALTRIRERLAPQDFFKEAHRLLFQTMVNLSDAGRGVDLLTVKAALELGARLGEVGGIAALVQMVDESATLTRLPDYIGVVLDTAARRGAIQAATELIGQCYEDGRNPAGLLAASVAKFETLSARVTRRGWSAPVTIAALGETPPAAPCHTRGFGKSNLECRRHNLVPIGQAPCSSQCEPDAIRTRPGA